MKFRENFPDLGGSDEVSNCRIGATGVCVALLDEKSCLAGNRWLNERDVVSVLQRQERDSSVGL